MKTFKRRQFLKTVAGGAGAGITASLLSKKTLSAAYQREIFKISGSDQYAIYIGSEVCSVTRFAAAELKKYLHKISSIELQINEISALGQNCAVFVAPTLNGIPDWMEKIQGSEELPDDGFIIRSGNSFAAMAGKNPRGSLYSVYTFLEILGCRFYGLGETGEIVPKMNPISIPKLDIEEKPTFRWREWGEDTGYVHRTKDPDHKERHKKFWLQLVDWFTKNRINTTPNHGYPELEEFTKRGIVHRLGGHIIPSLLPRDLFDEHPDYFRMDQTGKRVSDGNFCPSNTAALKIVAENAVKHVKKYQQAYNLQVWGEDSWEGSWCYCPECSKMTVQDQYITVCNAIAREVKKTGYNIDINAIAYHDTIEPDLHIQPEPNLRLLLAARERSYGHALNDMRSERNQWYAECFEKWASIFSPKNINLLEYYTDNILFRTFPISCPHLIARDVQYYTDVGLDNEYLICHLGDYAFQSEPLNCYVYTRMIYDRSQDVDEIIAEYCKNMYGPAAATMHKWHDDFEEAMHYCATFGDIQRVPTECSPRTQKLLSETNISVKMLEKTNLLVKHAKSETSDSVQKERINTQSWVNEFAILMVNGLLHQVRAEYYFGRINQIIWGRKARNRNPHKGLAGRYIQVRDEFRDAVKYYEEATAFIELLPQKDHSVWCDTALPSHNKGVCDEMRAKIAECEKHI